MITCAVRPQVTDPALTAVFTAYLPGVLGGTVRVPLSSPKVIGIANSRGERA
jgi:hypothetical protein